MSEIRLLVRGFTWKAKMFNDAVFQWWTPSKVTRKVAKKSLLDIANNNGLWRAYEPNDIIRIWVTK